MGTQKITFRGDGDYEAEKRAMIAAAMRDPHPADRFAHDAQDNDFGSNSETAVRTTGSADLSQSFSTNNVGFEQGEQAVDPDPNGRGPRRLNNNDRYGTNPFDIRSA